MYNVLRILFVYILIQSIGFSAPKSIKGEINLEKWNIEKQKQIDLNGEWHFFWNQFIEPERLIKEGIPKKGASLTPALELPIKTAVFFINSEK